MNGNCRKQRVTVDKLMNGDGQCCCKLLGVAECYCVLVLTLVLLTDDDDDLCC